MARRYYVLSRRQRVVRRLVSWREGVATPSTAPWAWIIGWLTLSIGSSVAHSMGNHHVASSRTVAVTFLIGLVGGCVWQWLNRRDPVDRFVVLASLMILVALLALVTPAGDYAPDGTATAAGVLAGNIVLEAALRSSAMCERSGPAVAGRTDRDPSDSNDSEQAAATREPSR